MFLRIKKSQPFFSVLMPILLDSILLVATILLKTNKSNSLVLRVILITISDFSSGFTPYLKAFSIKVNNISGAIF